MLLNAPAWNFTIGISDQNTLIEQSLCYNRAISCTMKYEKQPPTWLFEISVMINCESTWPGLRGLINKRLLHTVPGIEKRFILVVLPSQSGAYLGGFPGVPETPKNLVCSRSSLCCL